MARLLRRLPTGAMAPAPKSKSSSSNRKGKTPKTKINKLSCNLFPGLDVYAPDSPASPIRVSDPSSTLTACDFLIDIKNYIPAGCLRLERHKCLISADVWKSCDAWQWLGHPREIVDPNGGPFLDNALHEAIFGLITIEPYRNLHQAGWIRLAFKRRDAEWGQIRVYLLPDDIGRRMIDRADRALRKSLRHLMADLDGARNTWDAAWVEETPIAHIDSVPVEDRSEASLFYLFNALPSPRPDSSIVKDSNSRTAMEDILDGKVDGLKTTMMAYQRRSAALMLQKEAQPLEVLDPRLRKCRDQNGNDWYCDLITGTCLRTPRMYEAARGGICAETMGLGKTLICLSLILATRELSSQIPAEYSVGILPIRPRVGSLLDMSAATIGRTGTPWKYYFKDRELDGSDYMRCKEAIKRGVGHYYITGPPPRRATRNPIPSPTRKVLLSTTTLVVVPSNLVRQWEREIEKHTSGLRVLVMQKPQSMLPPATELREYDIILFSRTRFEKEVSLEKEASLERGPRGPGDLVLLTDSKNCSCLITASSKRRNPGGLIYCTGGCSKALGGYDNYQSPLRDLHFKRLITDEGHTIGNSGSANKTNAVIVVDFLQISARWIVSGTPTQGLYGAEGMANPDEVEGRRAAGVSVSPERSQSTHHEPINVEQERKDIEKLGNIATFYLKSQPWSNSKHEDDFADWSTYVMQPRHGTRSHGNLGCLRTTLEGMMIRHRPEDIEQDVILPPLFQNVVFLDGSLQDKLSLNMFSLMITSNAVTSERKDADYLFHPYQKKALSLLVSNLRQASFFWAGIGKSDVEFTIQQAQKYLSKPNFSITDDDRHLLTKAIQYGEIALKNSIWLAASENHEMPYYIQNTWTPEVQTAWALDGKESNPTLIGSTQLLAMQKFDHTPPSTRNLSASFADAGRTAMAAARTAAAKIISTPRQSKASKAQKKVVESLPALAGGLRVMEDTSPKKKQRDSPRRSHGAGAKLPGVQLRHNNLSRASRTAKRIGTTSLSDMNQSSETNDKKKDLWEPIKRTDQLSSNFLDNSATILSTASAKLSYLTIQILKHHKSEKIIVFYETENVAYYLAQTLEALEIEHLIYAKTLSSERRSQYIVTFNQNPDFRVLLMDISQAAFGLDVSAASRVFFINPPVNKQVEAQAVKRAHRIGQLKPVYVETLVLRGSIEEVIIERKRTMSSNENKKCKTVLDDKTMYDWIKNVRFVSLPESDISGPQQMAALETSQPVFVSGRPKAGPSGNPDKGLVIDTTSKKRRKPSIKGFDDVSQSDDIAVFSHRHVIMRHNKRAKRADLLEESDDPFTTSGSGTTKSSGPNSPSSFSYSSAIPFSSSMALAPSSAFTPQSSTDEGVSPNKNNGSLNGSRAGSPTKADRSRLNIDGAKSLLLKLQMGDEMGIHRRKGQQPDARNSLSFAHPDGCQSENHGYDLNCGHHQRNHEGTSSMLTAQYPEPNKVSNTTPYQSLKSNPKLALSHRLPLGSPTTSLAPMPNAGSPLKFDQQLNYSGVERSTFDSASVSNSPQKQTFEEASGRDGIFSGDCPSFTPMFNKLVQKTSGSASEVDSSGLDLPPDSSGFLDTEMS